MRGNSFDTVVAALKELGGYFVFRDADGVEFVVALKDEFDDSRRTTSETMQLPLDRLAKHEGVSLSAEADVVLDRINRELAEYRAGQIEQALDEMADDSDGAEQATKIRFEPLRGDLPPELQE